MKLDLRKPQDEDIAYLSWNLRGSDLRELYAVYGHVDALRAITSSIDASSEVYVDDRGRNPSLIFGICPHRANSALIWAVATPEIRNHRVAFIRQSRRQIAKWFKENPHIMYMYNFSHSDNTLHHDWLEWCGAHMLPSVPWGQRRELFTPFIIRRETHV